MSKSSPTHVQVAVRFRPRNAREEEEEKAMNSQWSINFQTHQAFETTKDGTKHNWLFDHVFAPNSAQETVYVETAKRCIDDVLAGYNATIFAYGQTGSGKTHTMFGYGSEPGVIPRACSHIFDHVDRDNDTEYHIKCCFLEIYKEKIRDLLANTKENLRIRQSAERGIYVQGALEQYCATQEDVLATISLGELSRTTSATKMNAKSSRSHSVFTINIEQESQSGSKRAKLVFIDLAGSEKVKKTGATGNTLEEAKKINQSLTCLGNVIKCLTEGAPFVPYRDSSLTRLLEESLQGNTKTTLFITCSPSPYNAEETVSSLRFGARVKTIKMEVKVNRTRSMLELEAELASLNQELKCEQVYNKRLNRLLSFVKSPSYDRTQPIPQEYLAVKPGKDAAASADVAQPSLRESPNASFGQEQQRVKASPTPTIPEEDAVELLNARLELQRVETDIELDAQQMSCEVEGLKKALEERVKERDAAREELERLQRALKAETARAEAAAGAQAAAKASLASERLALRQRLAAAQAAAQEETVAGTKLRADAAEAEESLLVFFAENERVRGEAAAMERALAEQRRVAEEVEARNRECAGRAAEARAERESLANDAHDVKAHAVSLAGKKKEIDAKLQAINAQIAALTEQVAKTKESIKEAEERCAQRKEAVAAMQREARRLREDGKKAVADGTATLSSLQEKLAEALDIETAVLAKLSRRAGPSAGPGPSADLTLIESALSALKAKPQEEKAEAADEQDALLLAMEEELDIAESAHGEADDAWHAAQRSAQQAVSLVRELEVQASLDALDASTSRSDASEAARRAERHVQAIRTKLQRLERDNAASEKRLETARAARESETQSLETWRQKVTDAQAAFDALTGSGVQTHAKLQVEQRKLAMAKSRVAELTAGLRANERGVSDLEERLRDLLERQHELSCATEALRAETEDTQKVVLEVRSESTRTQQAAKEVASIASQLEARRKVWKPPQVVTGKTMLDAYREKVDLADVVQSLRPTLSGAYLLEAARDEHEKSLSSPLKRPATPTQSPAASPIFAATPPPKVLLMFWSLASQEDLARLLAGDALSAKVSNTNSLCGIHEPAAQNKQQIKANIKLYEQLFKLADKEGKGHIDVDGLQWLMQSLGKDVSREEIEELLMDVDTDGNGTMEFMEFLRSMDLLNEFFASSASSAPASSDQ
eukprot:m51a1_g11716 putative kinesin heavy chain (1187) ;mRNA; r:81154-85738